MNILPHMILYGVFFVSSHSSYLQIITLLWRQMQHPAQGLGGLVLVPIPFKWYQVTFRWGTVWILFIYRAWNVYEWEIFGHPPALEEVSYEFSSVRPFVCRWRTKDIKIYSKVCSDFLHNVRWLLSENIDEAWFLKKSYIYEVFTKISSIHKYFFYLNMKFLLVF